MLVAIIEFEMNPGTQEEFSGLIGGLQSQVETIDGFISADPAASLNNDGMMYEISYWRDAEALAAWAQVLADAMDADKRRRVPQPDEAALWPEQVPMTSCESAQCRGHEPRWVLTDIPSGAPVKVVEQGMLFTLRHGQCTCACCNPDVCS